MPVTGSACKLRHHHAVHTAMVGLSNPLDKVADTAAAIEQLDLIIMTDSSVVHLAGSINKPVIDLLQDKPYWLYGAEGQRLKQWYQSAQAQKKR